jgi:glycolate oxidase iron-sulfur subunit
MQTAFTEVQLADPDVRASESILRACVHCGFCTATCPTYVLLGDELDSPRGRIYLLKDMLENERVPSPDVVKHIDRCLSCLACMTTCPSGVHFMHLVDHGRRYIEENYRRPWFERFVRTALARVLPYPGRFRIALAFARIARIFAPLLPSKLRAMAALAPNAGRAGMPLRDGQVFPAAGLRTRRVALLVGCVQRDLAPEINEATIRLLTRHGCEVVIAAGTMCCGALTHHLGREHDALGFIKANVAAWQRAERDGPLDAIVANASGCGTMLKDYGYILRDDPQWAAAAARVSALARDVSEVAADLPLAAANAAGLVVAYHSACSLQHGQQIDALPKRLLAASGFTVREPVEAHLCCGSAGTYNLLQPELAARLGARKAGNLEATRADAIAAGNIGCMVQIAGKTRIPVVHTVELLDWATGGPEPASLSGDRS